MYDLSDIKIDQKKLSIVIGEPEWYLMAHTIINSLTIILLAILFHSPGGRPLKCLPIAHQHFQSPWESVRPLSAHPAMVVTPWLFLISTSIVNM